MSHTYALIIIMAAMTMLLRFLPFILLKFTKETPRIIVYLGEVLPQAAIGMLVVYCLKDVTPSDPGIFFSTLFASLLAVIIQWRGKNIVYTVIGATAVYMVMLHLM